MQKEIPPPGSPPPDEPIPCAKPAPKPPAPASQLDPAHQNENRPPARNFGA